MQFQENARTDGRSEGQTDLILQDPFGYCRGSNNSIVNVNSIQKQNLNHLA